MNRIPTKGGAMGISMGVAYIKRDKDVPVFEHCNIATTIVLQEVCEIMANEISSFYDDDCIIDKHSKKCLEFVEHQVRQEEQVMMIQIMDEEF